MLSTEQKLPPTEITAKAPPVENADQPGIEGTVDIMARLGLASGGGPNAKPGHLAGPDMTELRSQLDHKHPADSEYPHFRKEYIYRLFSYTCYLNDKAETRANYLILANSVIILGTATAIPVLITRFPPIWPSMASLAATIMLFGASILSCVGAILPRTYDKGIPINHGVIGRQRGEDYVRSLDNLSLQDMTTHFGLEINILSKIVNTRFAYVGWAARFFFMAVLGICVTVALAVCLDKGASVMPAQPEVGNWIWQIHMLAPNLSMPLLEMIQN